MIGVIQFVFVSSLLDSLAIMYAARFVQMQRYQRSFTDALQSAYYYLPTSAVPHERDQQSCLCLPPKYISPITHSSVP
ncbi:hypothetical protein BU24DRAFT_227523 [Aaosphaeria arxii CBS 175.79]|uniref:Uncharacterized protein n=1 Tax=Aaosphaeria arxii CBS 175.79 TaxID=1450172 RepID=A0A6A5XQD6_9PLEO|nr:uncharacterized protein BU24DRAFT_227523 [Aaosphaeria arxii CBS 175.79]KAF2015047.1 hypothetical protein BU24DRAFT_227523 [Aaosphaeria arxii CBS 175.79]